MKKVLSVETILRYVDYDHVTGVFTSRVNRGIRIRVGKEAGHIFSVAGKRYRGLSVCGVVFMAHRLAWYIIHGSMPEGEIDHIDGNGLNNAISNLRVVSHAENHRNKRLSSRNKSGHSGARWDNKAKRWIVFIGPRYLGSFKSKEDAVKVRKAAEQKLGYHENHGKSRSL